MEITIINQDKLILLILKIFPKIVTTAKMIIKIYKEYSTLRPFYFVINRLIGYIEEIEGSSDNYLNVVSSLPDKKIISAIDTIWRSIKNKINPGIKIKDYGKFRFNSDIDLPLKTVIEFRSLVINVTCIFYKFFMD